MFDDAQVHESQSMKKADGIEETAIIVHGKGL